MNHRHPSPIPHVRKPNPQKAWTFGELVAAVYRACGKRRARGLVQLAVNAHVVAFRGGRNFVIS